jgi:hypothetical protein
VHISRYPLIISLFVLLLPHTLFSSATEFDVSLKDNKLSIAADDIPLQTILLRLAAEDITVRIDPGINPRISTNFKNRPLGQGLETILKSVSYTLLWESAPGHTANPGVRLAEIQVFQTGRKELMKPMHPPSVDEIARTSAGVHYVKDEIILFIPPETDLVQVRKLLQGYGATLVQGNSMAGLYKVLLPEGSDVFGIAREIKSKLGLGIAQPNYAYPIESPVQYPVGLEQADVQAGLYAPTDNSVAIAILDSGLAENIALDKFVISSLDATNPGAALSDTLGHGTQMAFIATGIVNPFGTEAGDDSYIPIIPIRTFDDNGYTNDLRIMAAINFALENNARVMSLSWGSGTKSAFMEKAFAYADAKGLVIVASAGNEPTGKPVYPAAYPSVIGVGALGPHGKTWENSNFGNFVALYAPGFANLPVGHKGDPGMYAGTSISAAYVANTIADFLSAHPDASRQEIRDHLNNAF